jgi:hypothetical protein
MNVRRFTILGGFVVAVAVAQVVFPLYPSPHSLCGLLAERVQLSSQVEEHHRGAILIVSGDAVAGRDGPWLLKAPCDSSFVLVGLDVPSSVLGTRRSKETLLNLKNPNFQLEDQTVPVKVIARVSANVNACFGPGTILTVLAVHVTGPVQVRSRPPATELDAAPAGRSKESQLSMLDRMPTALCRPEGISLRV